GGRGQGRAREGVREKRLRTGGKESGAGSGGSGGYRRSTPRGSVSAARRVGATCGRGRRRFREGAGVAADRPCETPAGGSRWRAWIEGKAPATRERRSGRRPVQRGRAGLGLRARAGGECGGGARRSGSAPPSRDIPSVRFPDGGRREMIGNGEYDRARSEQAEPFPSG